MDACVCIYLWMYPWMRLPCMDANIWSTATVGVQFSHSYAHLFMWLQSVMPKTILWARKLSQSVDFASRCCEEVAWFAFVSCVSMTYIHTTCSWTPVIGLREAELHWRSGRDGWATAGRMAVDDLVGGLIDFFFILLSINKWLVLNVVWPPPNTGSESSTARRDASASVSTNGWLVD